MIPTPILNIIFRQVNFSKNFYLTSAMLKMKAVTNLSSLFFYILIIFSLDSISATGNKNLCTESSGIWRVFNHTCYDNCSKKIDKNTPCYQILEYNCDCGEDKCWQNNKCTKIKNLKNKKYKTYKTEITTTKQPKAIEPKENNKFYNFIDDLSGKIRGDEATQCENYGGKMIDFRNGCADNCNVTRSSVCTQVITRSCDCGPGKCWDKIKCINQ
ncbi:MAG: hypothetical protein ACI9IL_000163 [Rickettsiales bacterium]|jgi:hypothetical protein